MPSRNEFDEEGYLQLNPDIAAGVAMDKIESGWTHFSKNGYAEGRRWISRPDPFRGVNREIAPDDEMFVGNETHYFDVGESALHAIESAIFAARRPRSTIERILDLPCGHGRVLRFLRQAFPAAQLTACDLNQSGVEFCARVLGAVPVISQKEVQAIPLPGGFDLIWCGSLLTHLPEEQCLLFLKLFERQLGHRGILVLTTHGRLDARELAAGKNPHNITSQQVTEVLGGYRAKGFGYADYSFQPGYGFSLTHPGYVLGTLVPRTGFRVIGCNEAGWAKRQDVICLQKD